MQLVDPLPPNLKGFWDFALLGLWPSVINPRNDLRLEVIMNDVVWLNRGVCPNQSSHRATTCVDLKELEITSGRYVYDGGFNPHDFCGGGCWDSIWRKSSMSIIPFPLKSKQAA